MKPAVFNFDLRKGTTERFRLTFPIDISLHTFSLQLRNSQEEVIATADIENVSDTEIDVFFSKAFTTDLALDTYKYALVSDLYPDSYSWIVGKITQKEVDDL